ncbi:MAG: META domain-containing protein [Blastocatellia bacterium]|nr:META domain-containing protein [Blastocatellia bacterium]
MKRILNSAIITTLTIISLTFATFANELPQGKWQLDGYNFKLKIAYPIDKSTITLNINEDGKLGGRSGCNVYGGSYGFENDVLKISDVFSTMMACDEMTMKFEQTFYQTLSAATEYSEANGILTLTDPKTLSFLRFKKAADEKPMPKCD